MLYSQTNYSPLCPWLVKENHIKNTSEVQEILEIADKKLENLFNFTEMCDPKLFKSDHPNNKYFPKKNKQTPNKKKNDSNY